MATVHTITTYPIDEHPNKEAVFQWIRENWHDLNDHSLWEVVDTLKALAKHLDFELDYSISTVPDRGEYVRFKGSRYIQPLELQKIAELSADCGFTGVCWDCVIGDAIESNKRMIDSREFIRDVGYEMLKALHNETEYLYSDKGLQDYLECNGYEFLESGELF